MTVEKFVKPSSWGPFPEPHTHPTTGEKWPPDGLAEPLTPQEQAGIGLSYPGGQDFGEYVQRLGECPHLWNTLNGMFDGGLNRIISSFDGPFSAGNVHPHTGLLLFSLAMNARAFTVVETGTFYGYSTWFLAKALDWWGDEGSKVYTLDPNPSLVAQCVRQHPRVEIIPYPSYEILPRLVDDLKGVDFAFLDSYKRLALMEFQLLDKVIVPGGIVAFHDTQVFNTGKGLWSVTQSHPNYDKMLFAGTSHVVNPHHYFGNADDRGLYVMRKKEETDPFLDVADYGTYSELLGSSLIAIKPREDVISAT